jgi:aspartyl protease family protein
MFVLFWVTLLIMLTLYFSGMLDARRNPNQNLVLVPAADGSTEVSLRRNRQGHYLATGLINGHEVEFLIDTGATFVALSASVANRLGLKKGIPSSSHTAGGVVQTFLVELDSVQLGPIRRHAVRASVVPDMPGEGVLLGMSFLRDLELIQRGDTLIIRP